MSLAQQIRELAGKADAAFSEAMASVDRGDRQSKIDRHRLEVTTSHERLAGLLMQNRGIILAALDLAEKVDAPETVEAVANSFLAEMRGRKFLSFLFDEDPDNCGAYGYVDSAFDAELQTEVAHEVADRAIAAVKGAR